MQRHSQSQSGESEMLTVRLPECGSNNHITGAATASLLWPRKPGSNAVRHLAILDKPGSVCSVTPSTICHTRHLVKIPIQAVNPPYPPQGAMVMVQACGHTCHPLCLPPGNTHTPGSSTLLRHTRKEKDFSRPTRKANRARRHNTPESVSWCAGRAEDRAHMS